MFRDKIISMKAASPSLRPQDVLILLKLIAWRSKPWRQLDVASALELSQAEIANSLERLKWAGLVDDSKRKVQRLAAIEFLVHAVKYVHPGVLGSPSRGIPTARSSEPLSSMLVGEPGLDLVWPSEQGKARGVSLSPIYETAPIAAAKDSSLHELLSLVDSLRVGGSRERKLAEVELKKRILKANA
jgi:hypothetical protein